MTKHSFLAPINSAYVRYHIDDSFELNKPYFVDMVCWLLDGTKQAS